MSVPALESARQLRQVMANHFRRIDVAARSRCAPIAWCTSVGPVELLRALGFEVYFPENHGAMLGATRMAADTMPRAHAMGYSPEVCSYLTSDIGSFLLGKSPLTKHGLHGIPRADVLVYNTNQCREVQDWFEFYGRAWSVPVIGIASIRFLDDVAECHVDATARQIEALIPTLEQVAGKSLDASSLELAVKRSRVCSDLWGECLGTSRARPAPMSFFDATIHMGPAVVLRGTDEACQYYRVLLEELKARAAAGVGALPKERFRLYWDGMPIWGKLRDLASLFCELGTTVVASTYCNSWVFDSLDPADPIKSMARASLELFIARAENAKRAYLKRMLERFSVDGILFHDSRTCPNNSNARFGLPGRMRDELGAATLVIDGDLNDLRCYSEEQARTSIEGFIEQLEERGS